LAKALKRQLIFVPWYHSFQTLKRRKEMAKFLSSLACRLNERIGGKTPTFLAEGLVGAIMGGCFLMNALAHYRGCAGRK